MIKRALIGMLILALVTAGTYFATAPEAEAAPYECWYVVGGGWHRHGGFSGYWWHYHQAYWTYYVSQHECPAGYEQVG